MPDTLANQEVWPQSATQKLGCGFPMARNCACFSLKSGALLSYALGNKKNHEIPLFRQQWNTFKKGDIILFSSREVLRQTNSGILKKQYSPTVKNGYPSLCVKTVVGYIMAAL